MCFSPPLGDGERAPPYVPLLLPNLRSLLDALLSLFDGPPCSISVLFSMTPWTPQPHGVRPQVPLQPIVNQQGVLYIVCYTAYNQFLLPNAPSFKQGRLMITSYLLYIQYSHDPKRPNTE